MNWHKKITGCGLMFCQNLLHDKTGMGVPCEIDKTNRLIIQVFTQCERSNKSRYSCKKQRCGHHEKL